VGFRLADVAGSWFLTWEWSFGCGIWAVGVVCAAGAGFAAVIRGVSVQLGDDRADENEDAGFSVRVSVARGLVRGASEFS
jgi:hypothetical protein